jgi:hypothetical protein
MLKDIANSVLNPLRKDVVIQNFLKGHSEYEDPTYIGFDLQFDFNVLDEHIFNDYENLGNPLLMDDKVSKGPQAASAIQYLKNINEPGRAEALKRFRTNLKYISEQTPWYFQTLTGVDKLFAIKADEPNRFNDANIEITTLESFDMKIASLIHLYRTAVWDATYHRWMLPENMRFFKCKIILKDYRGMHKTNRIDVNYERYLDWDNFMNESDEQFQNNFGIQNIKDKNTILSALKQKISDSINNFATKYLTESETMDYDLWKPNIEIECDNCEFTFLENTYDFTKTIERGEAPKEATGTIGFKVNNARINASYNLMGISINESDRNNIMGMRMTNGNDELATEKAIGFLEKRIKRKLTQVVEKLYMGNAFGFSAANIESTVSNLLKFTRDELSKKSKLADKAFNYQPPDTKIKTPSMGFITEEKKKPTDMGNAFGFSGNPSV